MRATDGCLYALFSKAIVRIDPKTYRCEKLADAPGPIRAGIAIQRRRLYFGIGSHLWSMAIPTPARLIAGPND